MKMPWNLVNLFAEGGCVLLLVGWMNFAVGHESVAIVPPVNELEILDPRVDPEGNPRAIVTPGLGNLQQIEVPPSVIVHRYYYTGDREFQAGLIPGGPTVLVVNHPRTGEQLYVEVQLLPGVPRVKYTHNSIVYDYGKKRIKIEFAYLGRPKVTYCNTNRISHVKEHMDEHISRARDWATRTGIPHAVHHVAHGTGEALNATADRIHDAGRIISTPATRLWYATPVSSLLETDVYRPPARVGEAYLESLPANFNTLDGTIPTVR